MTVFNKVAVLAFLALVPAVAGDGHGCKMTTPDTPIEKMLGDVTGIHFKGVKVKVHEKSIPMGGKAKLVVTSYTTVPAFEMDKGKMIITPAKCEAHDDHDGHDHDGEHDHDHDETTTSAPDTAASAPAPAPGPSDVTSSAVRRAGAAGLFGALTLATGKAGVPAALLSSGLLFAATGANAEAHGKEDHCEEEMMMVEIHTPAGGGMTTPKGNPHFPPRDGKTGGVVVASGAPATTDSEATAKWFKDNIASIETPDPPAMTDREKELAKMSAKEFMAARKAETVTCEEYATALTKRATHYKTMNQFMYWDNMPNQMDVVIAQAKALDEKAAKDGVAAIAPLYCLPVPAKGTMATTDFPSSAGVGILHNMYATADAGAVEHTRKMNGVVYGKTNVPEFAASWVTCNYANGCTLNAYGSKFTAGGSSGGGGSAVASYLAPVAFTEDTGGSTRHPAAQNHNFGYDPSRNHYPNHGNPGITYLHDQVGINTRSMDDVLAFDAAFLDIQTEHDAAAAATPALGDLKVGLPQYPFVHFYVPADGFAIFAGPVHPEKAKASVNIMKKYEAAKAALTAGGVTLVEKEWPDNADGENTLMAQYFKTKVGGQGFDPLLEICHSFTGQMAEWIRFYLDVGIGPKDVISDIWSAGNGHAPVGFMTLNAITDESRFRYAAGLFQLETIAAWNSYFDGHGVDVILTPASFCDALTFECMANGSCTMQYDDGKGDGFKAVNTGALIPCNLVPYFAWKSIPVPKIVFPVGADADGNPVELELWGRAGPKDATDSMWVFDDSWAKTADLGFLYQAKTLIDQIYTVEDLKRIEPALVTKGDANLF